MKYKVNLSVDTNYDVEVEAPTEDDAYSEAYAIVVDQLEENDKAQLMYHEVVHSEVTPFVKEEIEMKYIVKGRYMFDYCAEVEAASMDEAAIEAWRKADRCVTDDKCVEFSNDSHKTLSVSPIYEEEE